MAAKAPETLRDGQIRMLEDNFNKVRHPEGTTLTLIALECGLTEEETLEWFRKRNVQWRLEEGLPAKRGSVLD